MPSTHTYAELLQINEWIRKNADTWYWHCTTRTVQESKLFPTPAYMVLSYLQSYYRYPDLIRKVTAVATPEGLADRLRETSTKGNIINLDCIPQFYLGGRQMLIDMGMLKSTDGVDDLILVEDFSRRVNLSYHRNHAHNLAYDAGLRAQILPERRTQVFEADAIGTRPGDRLHNSLQRFMATANQYSFLSHCENRLAIHNQGPYRCGPHHEMLVRSFCDLAEGDLPWMDGVASEVTYNNLTIPVIVKDTHFNIVDDWASFESTPTYDHANVVAVGLYTSDHLTEGEIPVAMDNAATLADFLDSEELILRNATRELWHAMARWSRDQMLDAGALIYFSVAKELFHVAGVYSQSDWFEIDERAQRFKPLLNDEYARDFLAELLGYLSLPSQKLSPYFMNKHSDGDSSMWALVPYSVLSDEEWTSTAGPMRVGSTTLPAKTSGWTTSRGNLSLEEYNRLCRQFTPRICRAPYRYLDDQWVKTHAGTPLADELYRIDQERSRNLKDRGSTVTREELDRIRAAETPNEPVMTL